MLDSKVFFFICALVEEWEVTPNLLAGLDEFTCAMYGRRPLKYVNGLAIHAHQGVWVTRWVYKSEQIYIDLRSYHHVDVH